MALQRGRQGSTGRAGTTHSQMGEKGRKGQEQGGQELQPEHKPLVNFSASSKML